MTSPRITHSVSLTCISNESEQEITGKKKRKPESFAGGDYDEHNTQATTAEKLTAEDAIQNDRNYR